MMKLWIRANIAKNTLLGKLRNEKGGIEMTTVIIVLGIVVAVALVFRTQITTLVGNLFKNVDEVTKLN